VILKRITITNFRQFLGRQVMDFAVDADRNVTLVHGFNGAGKTAFLNAFVWCLYGDLTADFEEKEHLENDHAFLEAVEGGVVTVSVSLSFDDRGRAYTVERSLRVERRDGLPLRLDPSLKMFEQVQGEALLLEGSKNALQDRINRILSPKLTKFFFFNGERVEWLASADAYEDVEEGVRSMLDIEIYDRSIRHLYNPVRSELTNELKKYGGNDLELEVNRLNTLVAEAEAMTVRHLQLRSNLGALEAEREELVKTLGSLAEAQALAEARRIVEDRLKATRKDLEDCNRSLAALVSEDGFLAFGEDVLTTTGEFIADARQRGELPAKIKPQFVDDLLEAEICICGRTLHSTDVDEIACLTEWRRKTGLAAYEEAISLTGAQLEPMQKRRRDFFKDMDELQSQRASKLQSERTDGEELSAISARLASGEGGGDAAALQSMIRTKDEHVGGTKLEIAILDGEVRDNADRQEATNRTIAGLKLVDAKGAVVQRQITAVNHVAEALQKIYDLQKEDVRADLDSRIQDLWRDAAVKDYTASLDDEFRLRLSKRVGGVERMVTGASTGEKQVLALSFVGSLVAKARANEVELGS
jgi:DNA sulfur modification protein DndD